ncbi:MAG: JAB domain-containing protein, partial [Rhodanobacteraceae bacterium]
MEYRRDSQGLIHFAGPISARELLAATEQVLAEELYRPDALSDPRMAGEYCRARLALRHAEAFMVVFLDNRHRVIACAELFQGTIDGASVHPREVVRASLQHNAAAVIFAHNHPSGVAEPSAADRSITSQLREALALVGVRVLDHFVIGAEITSM